METLRTLAEVTITIAGFAALATLLRVSKSDWKFHDNVNLIAFYIMIETSAINTAVCFIPIVISNYLTLPLTFRVSAGIFFFINITYAIFLVRRIMKLFGKLNPTGLESIILWIVYFASLIFILFTALGLLGTNYQGNFIAIIFINLIFCLFFFLRLIYTITPRPTI